MNYYGFESILSNTKQRRPNYFSDLISIFHFFWNTSTGKNFSNYSWIRIDFCYNISKFGNIIDIRMNLLDIDPFFGINVFLVIIFRIDSKEWRLLSRIKFSSPDLRVGSSVHFRAEDPTLKTFYFRLRVGWTVNPCSWGLIVWDPFSVEGSKYESSMKSSSFILN